MRRLSVDPADPAASSGDSVGAKDAELVEQLPSGLRLLHPALLFVVVWALGLGGWLFASPDWFLRVAAAEKHVSASALFYFALSLGMFLVGVAVGPPLLRANERAAVVRPDRLSPEELDALRRRTYFWFAVGSASALYLLAAGTLRFGGVSAVVSFVSGGGSLEELAQQYFEPARRTGLTVWVHALVAVGPLTSVAGVLARDRSTARRLAAANIVGFILALLVSLAFAERLITFGYVVASIVAWVGVRAWSGRSVMPRSSLATVLRLALVGALVAGLWIGGEFSRTYLATRQTDAPISAQDVVASVPLAAERFLAYVTTSVNNGMYSVDHAREHGLFLNSGSALVTTIGFNREDEPLVGPELSERGDMLWQIFPYHTPLTTFSMPGDVFQDLGWIGPALIFWFGVAAGCVYARFRRGEMWALLVYPLVVAGILDSYRVLYWTRTEMVLPIVVIAFVSAGWYRARRSPVPSALATGDQSTPISAR